MRCEQVSFGSRKPDEVFFLAGPTSSAGTAEAKPASFSVSHICAIGELKPRRASGNEGKFGNDEKGHILGMVEDLVREQAWRAMALPTPESAAAAAARVVAFLSDGMHIVFFQCRLSVQLGEAGPATVTVLGVQEWPPMPLDGDGGDVLAGMAMAPPSDLGYGMPPLSLQGEPIASLSFLGMGATSLVFSGTWQGQAVAAKLFHPGCAALAEAEERALEELSGAAGVVHLVGRGSSSSMTRADGRPVLVTAPVAAQQFALAPTRWSLDLGNKEDDGGVGESRLLESAVAAPRRRSARLVANASSQPDHTSWPPVPPPEVAWPTVDDLCDLVDSVDEVHRKGWVHRDPRLPNWFRDSHGRFFLADCGSALPIGQKELVSTNRPFGFTYGPKECLEALARGDKYLPPATPANDFEQIARVAFTVAARYADSLPLARSDPAGLLRTWAKLEQLRPLRELLEGASAAAKGDLQAFKDTLRSHLL